MDCKDVPESEIANFKDKVKTIPAGSLIGQGEIERRRCQNERGSARKIHKAVSRGSGENGNGRENIVTRGSPSAILAAIDVSDLGEAI